jgi:VCBS repeat-containing protein
VGSLSFTDVDLTDHHMVSTSVTSAIWSGGATLPSGLSTVLASALTASVSSDSTGSGAGSVAVTFSAADFDFLAAGQTLTITYNVTVTDNTGASSTQPVTITVTGTNDAPVLGVDASGPHTIIATPNTTGSDSPDSTSGLLTFTDVDLTDAHQASASTPTFAWSGGTLTPAQQAALAAASTLTLSKTDSTGSGSGSIGFTYSAADKTFDFLAAGQTLTITYNVTVTDNTGASSTQPVTITVTGTNDAPVLAVDVSGPHTITELAGKTGDTVDHDTAAGSLSFTDVNLSDTHTVGNSLVVATWSGGATLPSGLSTVLASALTTSVSSDSTGSGAGSVAVTFSAADKTFDFLAAGQTLTITYNVTVTDNTGGSSTQPVTITVTGTNDAPVLAVDVSGPHTIIERAGKTGDIADNDTAVGSLSFTDVDLTDHHMVSTSVTSATWSGGATLPSGLSTVLASALTASVSSDSTGSGAGSVAVTFSAADKTFDFLAAGQTLTITYNVTVTDNTGASSTQPVTITVTGTNDAPVITSAAATVAVSEEGLPNGAPDTLPAGLDTTNSPTGNGAITASDADGDPLTMTLGAPSAPLTSGGVTLAWTLQDAGHTLIGKAGAVTIITATITDAGAYNVTLTGPIDHPVANQEDIKTFTVPVTVSDGHTTTPTTLSVTIEDDSPKADPVEVPVVPTDSKTNVMVILDLSGSMDGSSGLTGLTRLDVAKAAVNELLDQYDNRGDVMVRIVTFSDTGTAVGSAWQSVADAKAAIAALSAGGSTNYDAALLTAMGAFTDGTKLTGPGTQNVSYFLSDGDPTASSDWPQIPGTQLANGIQANEQAVWESFLTTNKIVSFALGIPNVGTPGNLDPIAFDPASGTQLADTPIIVTDLSQLSNALVFTIPPVTGSVLTGAGGTTSNSFGADGGFVQSITVDGVTYTFNPAANGGAGGITTSGGGSFTYDGTTKTLTVDTDTNVVGGELAVVMTTGAFTFQPPAGFSSESVGFVLVDRDGDTASSTIHFSAAGGPDHPPIVRDDHVITNIGGGSGTNIVIPDYALLYNDSDVDGQTITITGAITNVLGATSVTHASGNVTFTDNNTNGGSFTYTGSTTSPTGSDTGNVTIDRSQTGTTLTGTGFGEILIGRDGANNTINGNEGNDVLIGGTGNDTLSGGAGADMMTGGGGVDTFIINSAQSPGTVGGSGDAGTISGYDVITDFATATDILNLQGTPAPATGTNVNGTDSSLTINGQTIKSHTISNGIVTFDDADTFGSPLTLSSTADVAAAVDYLHRNNLGNAGATVAFVANIGGSAHTYVFEQVGSSPNAANDILVDLAGVSLSNLTALIPSHILPAGVAGSPMNLGLIDPADRVGSVTVAIAGVPSGWTLSEGTNNGDGSWTIQASSVSMLSITSPANYSGATALQVAMSWTNADGSSGFARGTDNVEVFAQGAPIFAWSGEDYLTGSSGKDLFVFAQPIGRDTIYSFNTSEDQIDLIGYAGFASFDNVKGHLTADANGNAAITLAEGQSITFFGVPVSSLSANNFVFDQAPALINAGTLTINDGALLPLSGIITNSGTIALDSTGNEAHLGLLQNGITLQGGGQIILSDNDENLISGTIPSVTLTNVDNTIAGAGQLGMEQMTLINNGTITAIGTQALVIDTGPSVVTNAGTLGATGSGGLIVNSDVANSGLIWANGGNVTINGAVSGSGSAIISGDAALAFGAASSANITFATDADATLILRDPANFTGTISGLSGADHIDLANISHETASVYRMTYSSSTNITTLVITDGTNTDTINLSGNYSINTAWNFSDDNRGGTIVSNLRVSAISEGNRAQSTEADNGGVGHGNDFNAAALPDAVEVAKGSDMAHIRGAAAKDSSTIDVAGAVVAHNDFSSFRGALSGDIDDQFHFANANPGYNGLGHHSLELPSQAASHPTVEIPPATTELAQIVDDILTQAAQAHLDPVTPPAHDHDVAWTKAHNDNQSNHFIIHA